MCLKPSNQKKKFSTKLFPAVLLVIPKYPDQKSTITGDHSDLVNLMTLNKFSTWPKVYGLSWLNLKDQVLNNKLGRCVCMTAQKKANFARITTIQESDKILYRHICETGLQI